MPSEQFADEAAQPEIKPEEALHVAQQALDKANAIGDLEERLAEVEDELTRLNLRLSEIDEDRDYKDLSREERIGRVREELFEQAVDGRGRSFDYADIRDIVFDAKPSPSYCYDLMKWAAEARGFEYREPASGNERLAVNPDEVRREFAFYSAKKAATGGGVRG